MKRAPTNTTKVANRNPAGFLAEAMLAGTSNAIERQEAQGQTEFVNSETLPTRIGSTEVEILKAAGVKFLGPVEGDPIFQYVDLPKGWKKVRTDHSMWSKLLDDKDRERGSIFYRAAFYDRSANMHLSRRYGCSRNYKCEGHPKTCVVNVYDAGKVIHTLGPVTVADESKAYDTGRNMEREAEAWLTAKYPDWENPGAYWD